jgi:hypothetical protein
MRLDKLVDDVLASLKPSATFKDFRKAVMRRLEPAIEDRRREHDIMVRSFNTRAHWRYNSRYYKPRLKVIRGGKRRYA